MKSRNFTADGMTRNGQLLIRNKSEMDRFLGDWPDSEFTLEVTLNEPGTSEALIAYYKRSIIPQFQRAFRDVQGEMMTWEQVDIKLREMSTAMHHQEVIEGQHGYVDVLVPIETAGNHRAVEYIKELKMIGATEFDIVIKEPK